MGWFDVLAHSFARERGGRKRQIKRPLSPFTPSTEENNVFLLSQVSDDVMLQGGGDWTNVIIPGISSTNEGLGVDVGVGDRHSGFNHRQSYEVTGLRQDAEYECLVQARNKFGWSEASRIFQFFTGKRGRLIL